MILIMDTKGATSDCLLLLEYQRDSQSDLCLTITIEAVVFKNVANLL